ncbi:YncE family protein [Tunturibacter psychrotolerans]|uniref:YncE family protein n=1 Tax=Tunturiibacter psychrotolerans TaxID=3069686 RepID=A0AAU7ZQ56_9BACT
MASCLRLLFWAFIASLLGGCACGSVCGQALTSVPPLGTLISDRGIVLNAAAHKIYAVDQAHGAVVVINSRTGVATSIATGTRPEAIAVNNATNRIYVVNSGAGNVSVIDGAVDRVTGTIKTDRRPYYIAVNEATNKAYVSNTFSKVMTVLDLSTDTPSDWAIGSGDAVAVDSKSNQVYLLGYEDPNLRIMNGATGEVTREPVGSIHAWALAIDQGIRKLYVTGVGSADVLVVDLESRTHTVIKVGNYPCAIAVNPKTHMAYVTNYADNTVSVIDGVSGKVKGTIPVGSHPQSVAVDPTRARVYVGNMQGNNISVIDASRMKIIQTLPAGSHPYAVVTDPETGAVYAGNMLDPENSEAPVYTAVITAKATK